MHAPGRSPSICGEDAKPALHDAQLGSLLSTPACSCNAFRVAQRGRTICISEVMRNAMPAAANCSSQPRAGPGGAGTQQVDQPAAAATAGSCRGRNDGTCANRATN